MTGHDQFRAGPDDPDDAARFAAAAATLVSAVEAAVPAWVERIVTARIVDHKGTVADTEREAASAAGVAARDETVSVLRRLVETDVDDQAANPLALLRRATVHANRVLADVGVPAVPRDEFAERAFPDDVYDLVPATWADVDPALAEPGLTWSAAKAYIFKARRRREGLT